MSNFYFNEESDYSKKNTSDNKNFLSTIFQPLQFEPEQKETEHIYASAADLLHIR